MASITPSIDDFLKPLAIDSHTVFDLSRELEATFRHLSAESLDQFLPTPISESILRPVAGHDRGRYEPIPDNIKSGGTNLRVAFVELFGSGNVALSQVAESLEGLKTNGTVNNHVPHRRLERLLEKSWPIQNHLKNENSENLFAWIGDRVAQVVRKGCDTFGLDPGVSLPMGVTFSFPMKQSSLSEATLMAMGKGFAITSDLDLGGHLIKGYEKYRTQDMPLIEITAISNDAVSTLVSFIFQFPAETHQKATMGLIVGTGSNATLPLKLSSLHPSKRPSSISVLPDQDIDDVKIAVNTEWSINGTAPPLRKLGLISQWDEALDKAGEVPGFQPLEYMTAGRYLGELARLIFVDYMSLLGFPLEILPEKLREKFGLTTTFISHFYPDSPKGHMLDQLEREFPAQDGPGGFFWEERMAHVLYRIAHSIEVRAAGIIAASTVGLLRSADEIPSHDLNGWYTGITELAVGYTGGCIQFFQNYLADTQTFIDEILAIEYSGDAPIRVTLSPCHDGGITGAGILVPAALASHST
ncbi:hypothetical protein B0H63DRAFT_446445 [Podospora didyma]|uniref:Phosphotransferase n=1 Tax=Podospora didyma TaxID=330526 RepID=A0AAE0NZL6_9PEZI|nr:hypothetical protein B0H63DRAFT_446445 [Podospora didyma]